MTTFYVKKSTDDICHYGILGQRWGVRRYQNKDGSLTSVGQKRYAKQFDKAYNKAWKYNEKTGQAEYNYKNNVKLTKKTDYDTAEATLNSIKRMKENQDYKSAKEELEKNTDTAFNSLDKKILVEKGVYSKDEVKKYDNLTKEMKRLQWYDSRYQEGIKEYMKSGKAQDYVMNHPLVKESVAKLDVIKANERKNIENDIKKYLGEDLFNTPINTILNKTANKDKPVTYGEYLTNVTESKSERARR